MTHAEAVRIVAQAHEKAQEAGRNLRDSRVKAGVSQADLRRKTGFEQSIVSQFERGLGGMSLTRMRRSFEAGGFPAPESLLWLEKNRDALDAARRLVASHNVKKAKAVFLEKHRAAKAKPTKESYQDLVAAKKRSKPEAAKAPVESEPDAGDLEDLLGRLAALVAQVRAHPDVAEIRFLPDGGIEIAEKPRIRRIGGRS